MSEEFSIHPQLVSDCVEIGNLALCRVLLMNDRRFPWVILVPKRAGLREFHEVSQEDVADLVQEINMSSIAIQGLKEITKLNVAALGNQTPQLHVHVIGRTSSDDAWPGPVWGVGTAEPYSESELEQMVSYLQRRLVCS